MNNRTYALESERLQSFTPDQKLALFEQELRARERPLRTLFDLAITSDIECRKALSAIPDMGKTPETLAAYNAAADHHYFQTWYAPETYADSPFTALYTFNMGFAVDVCGLKEKRVKAMRAGSNVVNQTTFHEIICALHGQICHFWERARIDSIQDAERKNPLAFGPLKVLQNVGLKFPFDASLSFAVLDMVSGRNFNSLMHLERSVGRSLIPGGGQPAKQTTSKEE